MRGRTGICIFEGTMDAPLYIQVLQQTLLPFLEGLHPDGHRFVCNNDPNKHLSRAAQAFLLEKEVIWWRTQAESPNCTPVENLWYVLKEL